MNYLMILAFLLASPAFSMTTKTESGVEVKLSGLKVESIGAPIEMHGAYGRGATLDQYLELADRECDGYSLRVEQFIDGDALVAYCRHDSGPATTYMAHLNPPSCKEGVLAKDHNSKFVCRVHKVTCTYDYHPYTGKEVAVDAVDNNHGCL